MRATARLLLIFGLTCAALTFGALVVGQAMPNGVIAYASAQSPGASDLYLLDLPTRVVFNLTRSPFAFEDHPIWSADGARITYQRVSDNLSQICMLDTVKFCYASAGFWDHTPRWSADGRWLAFLSSDTMLFVRDTRSGTMIHIGGSDRLILNPTWSPDGARIAFVQSGGMSFKRDLYIAPGDLSDIRHVSTDNLQVTFPAWSPDGRRIAVDGTDSSGKRNIYLIDLASGALRPLTDGGRDAYPVWSPDGARIVFISGRDGDSDLFLINGDGTGERRLTANDASDAPPIWSPDGTRIVFASDRDGSYHLYVEDVASGETELITSDSGIDLNPAWRP